LVISLWQKGTPLAVVLLMLVELLKKISILEVDSLTRWNSFVVVMSMMPLQYLSDSMQSKKQSLSVELSANADEHLWIQKVPFFAS
jgi:hypothetical protein